MQSSSDNFDAILNLGREAGSGIECVSSLVRDHQDDETAFRPMDETNDSFYVLPFHLLLFSESRLMVVYTYCMKLEGLFLA